MSLVCQHSIEIKLHVNVCYEYYLRTNKKDIDIKLAIYESYLLEKY